MIEIEYKFKIDRIPDIPLPLKKKRILETTIMYDNPNGLMQFTDGRIRLRLIGDEGGELSYKKPLPSHGGPKREIEYQTWITNPEMMKNILGEMDFHPTTSYERYRTKYGDENVEVTIDEYPFASFIEIEGERGAILEMAEQLGFSEEDHINLPCDTLFTNWRKEQGLPMKPHMRFTDYDE